MSEPVKQSTPSQNTSAASPEHEETKAHAARAVGGPERGRSQDQQDTQSLVTRFHALFQGREDCYGQFTPLAGGGKKATTEHGAIPPEAWTRHLAGEAPSLGVVPIVPGSNTCRWGVIDVDTHAGEKVLGVVDHAHVAQVVTEKGFPLLLTRSRRNGAHLWCFVNRPVDAAAMQAQLKAWSKALREAGAWDAALDVEIFPLQVKLRDGSDGSWVNLPYFGAARVGVDSDGHDLTLEDFLTRAEDLSAYTRLALAAPVPNATETTTAPRSRRPTVWTLDDAKAVLDRLKPERATDYHDRLKVGMALHHAGEGDDAWLDLWQAWNDRHCEPEPRKWVRPNGEYVKKWNGFDDAPGGVTMGTVEGWARDDQERAGLIYAVDTKPELLRWCIPFVAAHGKLQGLIGLPDRGKDTIAIRMAADLSRGRVFGANDAARQHEPLPTYYQSAEDKLADTILPRFLAAGGDDHYLASRPAVRRNGVNEPLTFDVRDLAVIRRDLADIQSKLGTGPGLIVVSPFEAYLPGKVDSWKSADIRRVIAPLSMLLEETGWAGLLVAHLTKGNGDGGGAAIHRVVGSQAFAAALRIAYLVGDDPTSPVGTVPPARVFIPMKRNLIPPDVRGRSYTLASALHPSAVDGTTHEERAQTVPVVRWGVETDLSAEDVLRGPGKINVADRAQTWLFEQFTRHGTRTPEGDFVLTTAKLKELAHDAGQAWNTVRKQFAAIGAVPEQHGKDGRFGEGAWRLREAF